MLVVDDDAALVETIVDGLSEAYDAVGARAGAEAARRLEEDFDALVTDLRMPAVDGLALLAMSRRAAPQRPVIVMTAYSAVDTAIESIRRGAYHYLTKPFKVDELALFIDRAIGEARLRREATALRRELRDTGLLGNLVGRSGSMREVCDVALRVADADAPVLILGETGTGKGVLARALHAESRRAGRAMVTVNCAALPEPLLESELFGHVRGAFTGATSQRVGLIEEADGGTLFLDEIGEMAMPLQAKLLDVLERGVLRALGSNKEKSVEVRFVAATHRNLRERVAAGQFREDLLFRLDVVTLEIPSLRHRRDNLPELLAHFLESARRRHPDSPVCRFSPQALERLLAHRWPGNVRELENLVERVVLLVTTPDVMPSDLPPHVGAPARASLHFAPPVVALDEIERRYAAWALDQLGGRKMATAEKLGIDRKTLARLLGGGGEG